MSLLRLPLPSRSPSHLGYLRRVVRLWFFTLGHVSTRVKTCIRLSTSFSQICVCVCICQHSLSQSLPISMSISTSKSVCSSVFVLPCAASLFVCRVVSSLLSHYPHPTPLPSSSQLLPDHNPHCTPDQHHTMGTTMRIQHGSSHHRDHYCHAYNALRIGQVMLFVSRNNIPPKRRHVMCTGDCK